jgi:hypothetical protein
VRRRVAQLLVGRAIRKTGATRPIDQVPMGATSLPQ